MQITAEVILLHCPDAIWQREREREREREMYVHLDIPCTPVVHDDCSKDMVCSIHRYWLSLFIAWTHKERLPPWIK